GSGILRRYLALDRSEQHLAVIRLHHVTEVIGGLAGGATRRSKLTVLSAPHEKARRLCHLVRQRLGIDAHGHRQLLQLLLSNELTVRLPAGARRQTAAQPPPTTTSWLTGLAASPSER